MPELPEVEASRALIDEHCTGRTILSVEAADDTSMWAPAESPQAPQQVCCTVLKGTQQQCVGHTNQLLIHNPIVLPAAEVFDGASSAEVEAALQGRKLVGAHRKGKQMWLLLEGDKPNLLMHFGTPAAAFRQRSLCTAVLIVYGSAFLEKASGQACL